MLTWSHNGREESEWVHERESLSDCPRALVSFSKIFDLGYTVLLLPLVDLWRTGYGSVHMSGKKIMGTSLIFMLIPTNIRRVLLGSATEGTENTKQARESGE